jgi:hypothetical protein
MNHDDIIRMAMEIGGVDRPLQGSSALKFMEEFAALVAAAEREKLQRDGWRQCAKGQRTTQYCGLLRKAVEAEREACAKLVKKINMIHVAQEAGLAMGFVQGIAVMNHDNLKKVANLIADAIRARGDEK